MWPIRLIALTALLFETGGAGRSAGRGDASFYVLSALERAMLNDAPPSKSRESIEISAARGETQAAQIVIAGGDSGLQSVDLTVSAPFAVKLYLEHYISIPTPSKFGIGGARAGTYPDALIPFQNPFSNARVAGPFDVGARRNQAVYVEIAIPAAADPGVYKGYVSITAAGRPFATVPLTLTIWNFAIPKTSSMHSSFQDYDASYETGPAKYYGYPPNSPEQASMARSIDALLIDHRVVSSSPSDTLFRVNAAGHLDESPAENRRLQTILDRPAQTDFALSFGPHYPFADPLRADRAKALTYLRESYRWFETRGLADKVFIRTNDEPEKDSDFEQTRAFADLVHEANPKWRVAITGGLDSPGFAKYLYGHLDIYIACAPFFDPVQAREQASRGSEFWSYTAVIQNVTNPSPHWQIDFPLLNFRILPWINFRYGLKGLLYWTSAYWDQISARGHSPWSDPCSLKIGATCFNGDGLLIYPGKDVGYVVPEKVFGKAVWGPIPTLRLKAIRDGLEDYELLLMAARRDPQAAMQAAIGVGCRGNSNPGDANRNCFHDWNPDPEELLATRARLAAVISRQP